MRTALLNLVSVLVGFGLLLSVYSTLWSVFWLASLAHELEREILLVTLPLSALALLVMCVLAMGQKRIKAGVALCALALVTGPAIAAVLAWAWTR